MVGPSASGPGQQKGGSTTSASSVSVTGNVAQPQHGNNIKGGSTTLGATSAQPMMIRTSVGGPPHGQPQAAYQVLSQNGGAPGVPYIVAHPMQGITSGGVYYGGIPANLVPMQHLPNQHLVPGANPAAVYQQQAAAAASTRMQYVVPAGGGGAAYPILVNPQQHHYAAAMVQQHQHGQAALAHNPGAALYHHQQIPPGAVVPVLAAINSSKQTASRGGSKQAVPVLVAAPAQQLHQPVVVPTAAGVVAPKKSTPMNPKAAAFHPSSEGAALLSSATAGGAATCSSAKDEIRTSGSSKDAAAATNPTQDDLRKGSAAGDQERVRAGAAGEEDALLVPDAEDVKNANNDVSCVTNLKTHDQISSKQTSSPSNKLPEGGTTRTTGEQESVVDGSTTQADKNGTAVGGNKEVVNDQAPTGKVNSKTTAAAGLGAATSSAGANKKSSTSTSRTTGPSIYHRVLGTTVGLPAVVPEQSGAARPPVAIVQHPAAAQYHAAFPPGPGGGNWYAMNPYYAAGIANPAAQQHIQQHLQQHAAAVRHYHQQQHNMTSGNNVVTGSTTGVASASAGASGAAVGSSTSGGHSQQLHHHGGNHTVNTGGPPGAAAGGRSSTSSYQNQNVDGTTSHKNHQGSSSSNNRKNNQQPYHTVTASATSLAASGLTGRNGHDLDVLGPVDLEDLYLFDALDPDLDLTEFPDAAVAVIENFRAEKDMENVNIAPWLVGSVTVSSRGGSCKSSPVQQVLSPDAMAAAAADGKRKIVKAADEERTTRTEGQEVGAVEDHDSSASVTVDSPVISSREMMKPVQMEGNTTLTTLEEENTTASCSASCSGAASDSMVEQLVTVQQPGGGVSTSSEGSKAITTSTSTFPTSAAFPFTKMGDEIIQVEQPEVTTLEEFLGEAVSPYVDPKSASRATNLVEPTSTGNKKKETTADVEKSTQENEDKNQNVGDPVVEKPPASLEMKQEDPVEIKSQGDKNADSNIEPVPQEQQQQPALSPAAGRTCCPDKPAHGSSQGGRADRALLRKVYEWFQKHEIFGFDMEWRPEPNNGSLKHHHGVALMQFAADDGKQVLVRTTKTSACGAELGEVRARKRLPPFLEKKFAVSKCIFPVVGDCDKPRLEASFRVKVGNMPDLRHIFTQETGRRRGRSLEQMAQYYFGNDVLKGYKDKKIQISDWSAEEPLSAHQIRYAAKDAEMALRLFRHMNYRLAVKEERQNHGTNSQGQHQGALSTSSAGNNHANNHSYGTSSGHYNSSGYNHYGGQHYHQSSWGGQQQLPRNSHPGAQHEQGSSAETAGATPIGGTTSSHGGASTSGNPNAATTSAATPGAETGKGGHAGHPYHGSSGKPRRPSQDQSWDEYGSYKSKYTSSTASRRKPAAETLKAEKSGKAAPGAGGRQFQ
ncbi:unnamed protein product [Amoebophrya sp. A120]|nr:unnamed protein product [Amoebophrya sp. A120]|eukprot:GSA120T00017705001.1